MLHGDDFIEPTSTVRKAIGRNVDDAHNKRAVKVQCAAESIPIHLFIIRKTGATCWQLPHIRCKTSSHRILGDRTRNHELQQVVRAAGFGADASELKAAEGLSAHKGAG